MENKLKIVILSGSGVSQESGIPTFRDAGVGLWENYDVNTVCTHQAWEMNSAYVNKFFNMLRVKYKDTQPNDAHKLIAELEKDFDVTVITQNVDNLHEQAGSTNVIHLHGEMMKCCSDENVEDESCWVTLPQDGFGESGYEIPEDYPSKDGGLLRPYIVLFGEKVPNITKAVELCQSADIFVVIGTSLSVYPAASLIEYVGADVPKYVIDPGEFSPVISDPWFGSSSTTIENVTHIQKVGTEGMKDLTDILIKYKK